MTERPPEGDAKERDRDIAEVIRDELARRRPVDLDAVRERRRLERDYLWLIRNADEATFRKALNALGWEPDSPELEELVRAWRALQR